MKNPKRGCEGNGALNSSLSGHSLPSSGRLNSLSRDLQFPMNKMDLLKQVQHGSAAPRIHKICRPSLVCQTVPLDDQSRLIADIDAELAKRATVACNQMALLGQAKFWPRLLLRTSETFTHLVVAKTKALGTQIENNYQGVNFFFVNIPCQKILQTLHQRK